MIVLHQPPPAWGLPSISPFCVKLETYLRMAKLEYKTAPPDVFKVAPNGRVPYVNLDGRIIGDSTLIIQALKKRFGDPLNGGLSPEQRAQALCLQRLMESHLSFAGAWLRWSDKDSLKYLHDYFKPLLPPLVCEVIFKMIRKDMMKMLRAQGIGEHNREDIIRFANADVTALSDLLGSKSFFLGEQPTEIDATMYGFLIQQLWVPWDNPVKQHALSLENLDSFCQRMKQRFWN
jgi:glutathione S-transferase